MLDFYISLVNWYASVAFIVSPLLLTIFVLGVGLGIAQLTDDKLFRNFLMIVVAAILLSMSFVTSDFGRELYINLSAEIFSALFALVIVLIASSLESWTGSLIFSLMIAPILLFFMPADNVTSNMPVNLATGLLGAWLTAYMIRKEWAWDPKKHGERLSNELQKAKKEREARQAEFGDYFMLIAGKDIEEIQQRIDFLGEHDMVLMKDTPPEFDKETETYYRFVNMKIQTIVKDPDAIFLQNREARLRILGFPDTTKRIYKQISGVLPCTDQKRIESSDRDFLHLEFKTTVPQKLFSEHLEEQIFQLAREWRHSEDENLQYAVDDLLEWGKKMQFIKE
jgi:hypothetical protein